MVIIIVDSREKFMFDGADSLYDDNKCAIHTAWSYNSAWFQYNYLSEYCPLLGDINLDAVIDVAGIFMIVNFILYLDTPTEEQQILSDYNSDGEVNITDVVLMVIYILDN